MAIHDLPTPPTRAGSHRRTRPRSCHTIAATLRPLAAHLRETVILVYCLLGGRSSRLNDHRRALLATALHQVERRSDLGPLRRAEVQTMRAIRRRLAADLGWTSTRQEASHAA